MFTFKKNSGSKATKHKASKKDFTHPNKGLSRGEKRDAQKVGK